MIKITTDYLNMVTDCSGELSEGFWKDYNEAKVGLKELFGGASIIEKEVLFEKNTHEISETINKSNLINKIMEAIDPKVLDFINSIYFRPIFSRAGLSQKEEAEQELRDYYKQVLVQSMGLARQVTSKTYSIYNVLTDKIVKIQEGTKISKTFKHFITDPVLLNEVQVLYSQMLNDKMVRGTLCLSIHPMDYLTASVNHAGWTSCFNTLDEGEYCASTLCLINSPNTIMVYLKSSSEDENYGWHKKVCWNSKKWRMFASLGKEGEVVHFGRNYPYENIPLMEAAKEMISELTHKTYEKIETCSNVRVFTPENMYNDANGDSIYTCATEKYLLGVPVFGREVIEIAKYATCPNCGEHFVDIQSGLLCQNCGEYECCADCGRVISEGGRTWVEGRSCYVCDCCYDESYSYCNSCNEVVSADDMVEYQSYYNKDRNYMGADYVCRHCAETSDRIKECSCCGELTHTDLVREDENGELICLKCLNNKEES